jgi:hypothetical protein
MKTIIIKNTKGQRVMLRLEDILNVWEHNEEHVRIVNFKQGQKEMTLKTEETLDSLCERINILEDQ